MQLIPEVRKRLRALRKRQCIEFSKFGVLRYTYKDHTVSIMNKVCCLIAVIACLLWEAATGQPVPLEPVLDERFMNLSDIAADISLATLLENEQITQPGYMGFEYILDFTEEPDRALVGKKYGYCFLAFRGTVFAKAGDVMQNFIPGKRSVCPSTNANDCCQTRTGYWNAYDKTYRAELERAVRDCAAECQDPDNCVVITGHSQGGSIAQVAGVVLQDLNPIVLTLGNEPGLFEGCNQLDARRWFRFGNTRTDNIMGLTYDLVPFNFPFRVIDGPTYNYGYTYVMSDDITGVAGLGLNSQMRLAPSDMMSLFTQHNLEGDPNNQNYVAYRQRIKQLVAQDTYPIRATGYSRGYLCTQNMECSSDACPRRRFFSFLRNFGSFSKECN